MLGLYIEERHFETGNGVIAGAEPMNDVLVHAVEQEFGAQRVLTDEQRTELCIHCGLYDGNMRPGALA